MSSSHCHICAAPLIRLPGGLACTGGLHYQPIWVDNLVLPHPSTRTVWRQLNLPVNTVVPPERYLLEEYSFVYAPYVLVDSSVVSSEGGSSND